MAGGEDAGTSGAGAVPLRSAVLMGQQKTTTTKQNKKTTQIISDVCLITNHVAYASSNKTQIV